MKVFSVSSFRRQLALVLDQVADDHDPVLVTREGGKPSVVILALADFLSYEESDALLNNPANAARLKAAVKHLAAGRGTERDLIE